MAVETPGWVGRSTPRLEGRDKVRGKRRYVADVRRRDEAFARIVLSPHARARVTSVDREAALKTKGVIAVFTSDEMGREGILAGEEVHYVGEPVAVVVAETEAAAEDGADALVIHYEAMEAVTDPVLAMRRDAPAVRPDDFSEGREDAGAHGADVGGEEGGSTSKNVTSRVHFHRGDVDAALQEADVEVEGTYRIPEVHQGYLETHGTVVEPGTDGHITIWASTQGQFSTRSGTAAALGIPDHLVTVNAAEVGGGFGGKYVLHEPIAAVVAKAVGRPIRIILDRLQDFLYSNPSPAAMITVKLGAKRDGTLTAIKSTMIFDSGALPEAPAGIAAELLGGTYPAPNLDIEAYEVLTNKTPVGAYRAPGAPQAYFALESEMDRLAKVLGMDPIELRLKNAAREGSLRASGRPYPRIGLVECLEAVRDHPFWKDRKSGPDEGYGVAVGGWLGGTEPAAAACSLNGDGSLVLQLGSTDITGTNTTFAQIAAQVFGMDPERVSVTSGNTDQAPYAGASGGSKVTYTVGAAVLEAAQDAKRQILEVAGSELEASPEDLELENGEIRVKGVPGRSVSLERIARLTTSFGGRYAPVYGRGRTSIHVPSPGFAVHVAKVRVDRATGEVKVIGYLAVQDVGRALNPAAVTGQIRGGVAQGIGRALLEDLVHAASGQLLDGNLMDYMLPTATDIPPIEVVFVEVPSPLGPFGAKGVGEPPAIPGAAAIANAVEDAAGVRMRNLPIRPDAVMRALEELKDDEA